MNRRPKTGASFVLKRAWLASGACRDRTGDLRLANTVLALENFLVISRFRGADLRSSRCSAAARSRLPDYERCPQRSCGTARNDNRPPSWRTTALSRLWRCRQEGIPSLLEHDSGDVLDKRTNLQRCDWSYSKPWSTTILPRRVRGRASSWCPKRSATSSSRARSAATTARPSMTTSRESTV